MLKIYSGREAVSWECPTSSPFMIALLVNGHNGPIIPSSGYCRVK